MKRFWSVIFLVSLFCFTACSIDNTISEENMSYDEMLENANLNTEQNKRIEYLINILEMAQVSYSFDSPRELSMTSMELLMRENFYSYAENTGAVRNDMKELLDEEKLLNGFEDLFGIREIPFNYEFTDWKNDGTDFAKESPLTYVLQKGVQGLPEMGGIAADFRTVFINRDKNSITVKREMSFNNEEAYFWDEANQTFYYRDEAVEKFGDAYDFEHGEKLPEGIVMRCFPSFVRTMEYTFEISDGGHIFIKSGKVIK